MKRIAWTIFGLGLLIQPSWAAPGDQLFSVTPDQPVTDQDFGDAISIHGNYILVGAENTNDDEGIAYLFDAATGGQLHVISPTDPPESRSFGTSVDLWGSRLLVGASDDSNAKGAAYVFDLGGTQLHKLTALDGQDDDEFGGSLAISGNFALVGAPAASSALGKAYLFDVTTGSQIGNALQPVDLPTDTEAEFGDALDIDGNLAIVGMANEDLGGAAYIFDTTGAQLHKLTPPIDPVTMNPVPGFGRSVAISGNIAIVGATPGEDAVTETDRGRAYLYNATTGALLFELLPDDSQAFDLFGEDVNISGNLAVVTAEHEAFLGDVNKGYLFDVTTGQLIRRLMPTDIVPGDEALESIAIDGGRAIAGHEAFDSSGFENNGRAIVFDIMVGDFNADGVVDAADYTVWRDTSGQTVAAFAGADANGDTQIDTKDYALWKANFGVAAPQSVQGAGSLAGATGVPEPGTGVLLFVALAMIACGRRISG